MNNNFTTLFQDSMEAFNETLLDQPVVKEEVKPLFSFLTLEGENK